MKLLIFLPLLLCLVACATGAEHKRDVMGQSEDKLTVGVVQREISVGMSGAEVAEILGSPNLVTTDSERRETWVYDKVATNVTRSSSGGYVGLIIMGFGKEAASASTTQSTLTVIVKFDNDNKVRDFAYHSSTF